MSSQGRVIMPFVSGNRKGVIGFSAEKLRTIRTGLHQQYGTGLFTQKYVAEELGMETTNYLIYERGGGSSPSPGRLVRLAEVLSVEPCDLVEVDGDGPTLRQYREWIGLTQDSMASELSKAGWAIGRDTYAKVETGSRELEEEAVSILAEVLGISRPRLRSAIKRLAE